MTVESQAEGAGARNSGAKQSPPSPLGAIGGRASHRSSAQARLSSAFYVSSSASPRVLSPWVLGRHGRPCSRLWAEAGDHHEGTVQYCSSTDEPPAIQDGFTPHCDRENLGRLPTCSLLPVQIEQKVRLAKILQHTSDMADTISVWPPDPAILARQFFHLQCWLWCLPASVSHVMAPSLL